jgi:outer membrane protein OmpA-like peptidoglycan-associated protein
MRSSGNHSSGKQRIVASLCASTLVTGCAATAPHPMELRRVILYQNGIGYFERSGHVGGDTLKLDFARGELDDVLKTLTVIDRLGAGVATVDVPTLGDRDRTIGLGVRLSAGRVHDVQVSYAVPTPTWKAAYRVVLDDHPAGRSEATPLHPGPGGLLQAWAMVNNVSQEDWNGVSLTLATGAPMSFALDLHTPEYVKRPDATGHMVAPTILGPIDNERIGALDSDADGIVDAMDKCPDEPETFNGYDDVDGCPDRGRVVVTSSAIELLEQLYFAVNGDALAPASGAILDAVAATLRGNADIAKVEIGGHASDDEVDVWGLASRRAAVVRAALIERGVEPARLVIVPYGATRTTGGVREHDRRVEFLIAERRDAPARTRHASPMIDTRTAAASVHTATKPADVAGSVRYVLSEPVSIRRGASTMVSILDKPVGADDVFLFRPDPNAPGSDRHPFRAVRLVNDSGFTLEPGPIAIFARGTFVGDSLLGRLDLGETAWIPYALDGGTTVTVTTDDAERAVKLVSIHRGVFTVENAGVRTTRYAIAAGREPAKQIYLRHDKAPGYTANNLPPGTLDRGDAYVVALPLQPGKTSSLVVEERQPRRRTIQLLDAGATELSLYVDGAKLPPGVADTLHTAIALRTEIGAIEDDVATTRARLGDLAARAEEVRESLHAVEKIRADDLRKKLIASLAAATGDADALARALTTKTEALVAARNRLQDVIRDISLDQ